MFTTSLKAQTCMMLDASIGNTMIIKTTAKLIELVDNMSLDEYWSQDRNRGVQRRKCAFELETHDAFLTSNKLLSAQLETITKN